MNKRGRNAIIAVSVVAAGAAGGGLWFKSQLAPMPQDKAFYVRFEGTKSMRKVLTYLEEKKVVRNAGALYLYARIKKQTTPVGTGTYTVQPGMNAAEIFKALRNPIRQNVRLPENFWIKRNADILEKKEVCAAADYIAWANKPQEFQKDVSFPLPKKGSLEGYLYPDTYDLPPKMGAKAVVKLQLQTFEKKVWKNLKKPKDIKRTLTIASMVQLEVAKDSERPIVAGVIENRIRQGMRLQIDATVLYAMQIWKVLKHDDIVNTVSPYNTYKNNGLPPGPICSPSVKSILASEAPSSHPYLFYVAMPDRHHLFASTLADHNANIRKRIQALKGTQ